MGEGLGFLSIPVHGLGDTRLDVVAETWLSAASQDTARAPHTRQPTAWVTAPPHRAPRCLHHCLALHQVTLHHTWHRVPGPASATLGPLFQVAVSESACQRPQKAAGEAEEGTCRPQPRLGINFPR